MLFIVFIVLELQAQSAAAAKLKVGNDDEDGGSVVDTIVVAEAAYTVCFSPMIIPDIRRIVNA
jgi:hypothetical protein